MGQAGFSGAGKLESAVRPDPPCVAGQGLGQLGDTANATSQCSAEMGLEARSTLSRRPAEGHLKPMGGQEREGERELDESGDAIFGAPAAEADGVTLEEEEGDVARVRRAPKGPSQREREEH